ncbi:hypothetical protein [Limosilactobacillus balticus]|uniref:Abi family protein n=1 Tax=Limosilactobacillus balticus TaxID=2759747 RepID=A0ABS8RDY8_9LACO|nr:hypothetical protein [Limosilactobacillus balticus]MBB1129114.1 hypothetical protein [Limosilactobacillus balticus]MCD7139185.1 hypothetical protein [Limosilactobacillus balticus]
MKGTIIKVYRNYGIVKAEDKGKQVEFMFYIFPDMVNNGEYKTSKKVSFDVAKTEVRNSKVSIAYNIKPLPDSEVIQFHIQDEKQKDYPYGVYKDFFQVDNNKILLEELIAEDEHFKEFTLKWVLFLEKKIRQMLVVLVEKYKIKRGSVYDILKKETKTDYNKIMRELGKTYKFRNEFNLLTIKRKNKNDDMNFEVLDAPLALYLGSTTLDKLHSIVKALCSSIFDDIDEKEDENVKFLKRTLEMFGDLSIIRNAAAHGRPLIPLILDDKYAPNELYDLSSVDPKFNSGTDVTQWKLFQPIRYVARQITKEGFAPTYFDGGLQNTGLYTSKYILSNPARRSFFSYLYILEFYFRFVDGNRKKEFVEDLHNFVPLKDCDNLDNYLLAKYPKKNPVLKQAIKFTYPLWWGESFWIMVDNGILMDNQKKPS